jgi:hypothetical protein
MDRGVEFASLIFVLAAITAAGQIIVAAIACIFAEFPFALFVGFFQAIPVLLSGTTAVVAWTAIKRFKSDVKNK